MTWISKTCFIISTKYKKEIANTSTPYMNCDCKLKLGINMYIFEMALNFSVFLVPIQEKIKINKCQHKQSRFICNLWMQCNVFPPVWCFMKGGRKCYNYKSCPHWMAVISELHHFCFLGENPIDTNNDYHVLINCYLFDMGRAFSLCYYFFLL